MMRPRIYKRWDVIAVPNSVLYKGIRPYNVYTNIVMIIIKRKSKVTGEIVV